MMIRSGIGRATVLAPVCVLTALLVVLLTPSGAWAHASLVDTTPGQGTVVDQAPARIRLQFSEVVEAGAGGVSVVAPDGSTLPGTTAKADPRDTAALLVPFPDHPTPGTYVVHWTVLSIDGHPVSGEFRFAYQRSTSALTARGPEASAGVPPLAWLGRAMSAAGMLCLVGLAAFPWSVARAARSSRVRPQRRPPGVAPADPPDGAREAFGAEVLLRLRRPVAAAAGVAACGTVLVFLVTVATSTGTTVGGVLAAPSDWVGFVAETRTGLLLAVRLAGIAALAALVLVWWKRRTPSRAGLAVTGTVGLLPLLTFGLSSHAASAPADGLVAVGFDLLHLVAASVWVGGLLGLAVVGLPAARAVGRNRAHSADLAAAMTERFSMLAQLAMLAVLATGGYLALLQVDRLQELTESAWGRALTVKIGLWLTVLLLAGVNAVVVVPRLAARAGSLQRRSVARGELTSGVRLELVLAGGLVVVAALMSATPPPSSLADVADNQAATRQNVDVRTSRARGQGSGYDARVVVSRIGRGPGVATVFRVDLTTEGTAASAPSADAMLTYPGGADRSFALHVTGAGEWLSDRLSVPAGRYVVTARFQRSGETVAIPVKVKVPS